MECSYEEQLEITKSKYNSVIMKLKGEFEARTKEQQDAYSRLKDELANTKAQYEEFVRQQDEDHEDEARAYICVPRCSINDFEDEACVCVYAPRCSTNDFLIFTRLF